MAGVGEQLAVNQLPGLTEEERERIRRSKNGGFLGAVGDVASVPVKFGQKVAGAVGLGDPPQIGEDDVATPTQLDYSGLLAVQDRAQNRASQLGLQQMAVANRPGAPEAQAALINRAPIYGNALNEASTRGLQGEQIGRLTDAAEGRTTSAAELQQRKGVAQAIAGQMALANSARGGAAASIAAQRNAANQASTMSGQAVQDASMLRAQEQARAREALSQAITQQRAGDLGKLQFQGGLEMAQARLQQESNMLNPQLFLQSRSIDDQRLGDLLGAELQRDAMGADAELRKLQLQQQLQQMILQRDLGIASANLGAEQQQQAGLLNLGSAGLGFLSSLPSSQPSGGGGVPNYGGRR